MAKDYNPWSDALAKKCSTRTDPNVEEGKNLNDPYTQMSEYPWYMGEIECSKAESTLEGTPTGTFLVRYSKIRKQTAISFSVNGEVKHMMIRRCRDGVYIDDDYVFESTVELVQFYSNHSLVQISQSLNTCLKYPYRQCKMYKAVHDYTPPAPNTDGKFLSLKTGDVVVLLDTEGEDRGWWKGQVGNKTGVFPLKFVEPYPPVDGYSLSTLRPTDTRPEEVIFVSDSSRNESPDTMVAAGSRLDKSEIIPETVRRLVAQFESKTVTRSQKAAHGTKLQAALALLDNSMDVKISKEYINRRNWPCLDSFLKERRVQLKKRRAADTEEKTGCQKECRRDESNVIDNFEFEVARFQPELDVVSDNSEAMNTLDLFNIAEEDSRKESAPISSTSRDTAKWSEEDISNMQHGDCGEMENLEESRISLSEIQTEQESEELRPELGFCSIFLHVPLKVVHTRVEFNKKDHTTAQQSDPRNIRCLVFCEEDRDGFLAFKHFPMEHGPHRIGTYNTSGERTSAHAVYCFPEDVQRKQPRVIPIYRPFLLEKVNFLVVMKADGPESAMSIECHGPSFVTWKKPSDTSHSIKFPFSVHMHGKYVLIVRVEGRVIWRMEMMCGEEQTKEVDTSVSIKVTAVLPSLPGVVTPLFKDFTGKNIKFRLPTINTNMAEFYIEHTQKQLFLVQLYSCEMMISGHSFTFHCFGSEADINGSTTWTPMFPNLCGSKRSGTSIGEDDLQEKRLRLVENAPDPLAPAPKSPDGPASQSCLGTCETVRNEMINACLEIAKEMQLKCRRMISDQMYDVETTEDPTFVLYNVEISGKGKVHDQHASLMSILQSIRVKEPFQITYCGLMPGSSRFFIEFCFATEADNVLFQQQLAQKALMDRMCALNIGKYGSEKQAFVSIATKKSDEDLSVVSLSLFIAWKLAKKVNLIVHDRKIFTVDGGAYAQIQMSELFQTHQQEIERHLEETYKGRQIHKMRALFEKFIGSTN